MNVMSYSDIDSQSMNFFQEFLNDSPNDENFGLLLNLEDFDDDALFFETETPTWYVLSHSFYYFLISFCYFSHKLAVNEDDLEDDLDEELELTSQSQTQSSAKTESSNPTSTEITKQKRRKPNRSLESIQRRNQRRRIHPFPRILKRDIRREYINMYANVMNSADCTLMARYVNRFFHPNVIFSKTEFKYFSKDNKSIIYEARGKQIIYNYFVLRVTNSPDFIIKMHDTQLRVDPKTNCSVITSHFTVHGTKIKSKKSHHEILISRMNSLLTSPYDTFQYNSRHFSFEEEKKGEQGDTNMNVTYLNQTSSSEKNGFPQNFFQFSINSMGGKDVRCTTELLHFLRNHYPVYDNCDQTFLKYMANGQISSKYFIPTDDDPLILLKPQFKTNLEGALQMHLDENFMVSHLETRLASMHLEPVFIE